jgi:hypothetical protein
MSRTSQKQEGNYSIGERRSTLSELSIFDCELEEEERENRD